MKDSILCILPFTALALILRLGSAVNTRLPSEALAQDGLKGFFERSNTTLQQVQGERNGSSRTHRIMISSLLAFSSIILGTSDPKLMLFTTSDINDCTKEITLTFIVPEKDFIYKDFITCSVHEPTTILSPWKTNKQSINHYDPSFKEAKQVFNETFSITMTAATTTSQKCMLEPIYFYCSYYRKSDKKINDALFVFSFNKTTQTNILNDDSAIESSLSTNFGQTHAKHNYALIEHYYNAFISHKNHIITFFFRYYKESFLLFLICMIVLLLLFSFYQDKLANHKKLYELLEMLLSSIIFTCVTCTLLYLYGTSTSLNQLCLIGISVLFLIYSGYFFIKKSAHVSLNFFRTFYTCIGMICMSYTLLLLFKIIQYAEEFI